MPAVVDTIAVGPHPLGVAITRDGAFAYVASEFSQGYVAVISTARNTVVSYIRAEIVEPYPIGISLEVRELADQIRSITRAIIASSRAAGTARGRRDGAVR